MVVTCLQSTSEPARGANRFIFDLNFKRLKRSTEHKETILRSKLRNKSTLLAYSKCALACLQEQGTLKGQERKLNVSENPGALLSSLPFLFAQRLFHPGEWPLHSSAVFFLGGHVSCDQIRLLFNSKFPLQTWLITPPTSTRFDMLEFSH